MGREAAIDELKGWLTKQRGAGVLQRAVRPARLITLTGAGGSGKTRLSLQYGAAIVQICQRLDWHSLGN